METLRSIRTAEPRSSASPRDTSPAAAPWIAHRLPEGAPHGSTVDAAAHHLRARALDPLGAMRPTVQMTACACGACERCNAKALQGAGGHAAMSARSPEALQRDLGRGAALPGSVSSRFSQAYSRDLSGVGVHPESSTAASMGARAFTVGDQIAFAPGEYRPGTPDGDRLIGHELAHVVQQSGGTGAVQAKGLSYDRYEAEADAASSAALAGRAVTGLSAVTGALVQRDDVPRESLTPELAKALDDARLARLIRALRDQLSAPHLDADEARGARENLTVLEAEQMRRNAALLGLRPSGPTVPRPAGLPLNEGLMLRQITDFPESFAASMEEGKITTISPAALATAGASATRPLRSINGSSRRARPTWAPGCQWTPRSSGSV